ncbi:ABC transporter permease [Pantoea vagans]|uniref:ABC transporter permease n=1 Tax=Pantoea vagans TaxID=470934 RepID=UPI0023B13DD1|nr:ABC transporter permease [Pantoea vagans]MDE8559186.1 ABC transporter permease [Pantoea vagans]MDE8579181.1 ABC transporter permease [Pantoea vagans]
MVGEIAMMHKLLPPICGVLSLILLWEGSIRLFDIQPFVLPSLHSIVLAIIDSGSSLWVSMGWTLVESLSGFAIGLVVGLSLAMLMMVFRPLEAILMPLAVAINSVPTVAWIPLALIWFGMGAMSKIVLVVLAVSFVILVNSLHGLKQADPQMINLMRSFGANRITIMRRLQLPAALPNIVSGLRVGLVRSIIVAIVAEMLGAYQGIGWTIFQSTQQVDLLTVWAAVVVSSLVSIALYELLVWIDTTFIWWK